LHGDTNKCLRLIGSALITMAINLRWKQNITDSQNGFRAIKTDMAKTLDLKENITTIEQEMIMKALRKGCRISEIPTHEYARKHGKSVISLRRVWFRYVYSVIKNIF